MHRCAIRRSIRPQRGAAFMLSILVLALVGVSAFVMLTRGSAAQIERDAVTNAALAQAKAALIGYAAGVALTGPERLGDLPCPDNDNDGDADPPCATETTSLGRLPWRTLGLPDLRDGSGERLWYAVSARFRNSPRLNCPDPADIYCVNSDSRGTITVRASNADIVMDGTNPDPFVPSGAIAVVIAPGDVIVREGSVSSQVRQCTVGTDCDAASRCTPANPRDTPTCNPVNYLDIYPSPPASTAEDNADFIEAGINGFIMGPVVHSGRVIVNDRVAAIAYRDLIPLLERRVVREVRTCLDQYAAVNNGRYPWAADTTNSAFSNDYADVDGLRAGRIPDTLNKTQDSNIPTVVANVWPGAPCMIGLGTWWRHWKLHVYYSVADFYKPAPAPPVGGCTSCLTIQRPAPATPDLARYFVMAAGPRLAGVHGGQPRDTPLARTDPANYIEGENNYTALLPPDTPDTFKWGSADSSFNDVTIYR